MSASIYANSQLATATSVRRSNAQWIVQNTRKRPAVCKTPTLSARLSLDKTYALKRACKRGVAEF